MLQENKERIIAKKWILDHFDQYGLGFTKRQEMVELLNILQAAGECLDSMHNCVCNGHREFMDIIHMGHGWESDAELYDSIKEYNAFYTEEEFIEYIMDRWKDLKDEWEEGDEEPQEVIHHWTFEGEIADTKVYKTEDGYVVRVWY